MDSIEIQGILISARTRQDKKTKKSVIHVEIILDLDNLKSIPFNFMYKPVVVRLPKTVDPTQEITEKLEKRCQDQLKKRDDIE